MSVTMSRPRSHPEGVAVDVLLGETKLATVYGCDVDEATWRATKVRWAFEAHP